MSATKTKVALVTSPLLMKRGHHPLFPPLGLAYMAAVLEQNGFEVKIFDCPVCEMDHEKLKSELSSYQPTMVGIGSMTPTIESALKSARVAREACPDAKILMGGPHATFSGDEILASEKAVDIIVRGEGEETLLELARQQSSLGDIKGIAFRKDDKIVQTANRPYIQDLDALPLPAYKLLPMDKYNITGRNLLSVISSRGCPYQCPFCVASQMFGAPFRARSPSKVLDEMEWLRDEFGAEGIAFQDDTLTFDKNRALQICDGMTERKMKLPWGCGTRADAVTKDLVAKMSKAHCDEVMFGVESGCQRMRDVLKKRVTNEQCENAIKWTKDAGIFVTVSVILGLPWRDKGDAYRKAWILFAEWNLTMFGSAMLHLSVEPNSASLVKSYGWKMSDNWAMYNTMNPIFEDPALPAKDIAEIRTKFYHQFYTPKYVMRQTVKGYLKGNLYSKIMVRTGANYMLWRTMAALKIM